MPASPSGCPSYRRIQRRSALWVAAVVIGFGSSFFPAGPVLADHRNDRCAHDISSGPRRADCVAPLTEAAAAPTVPYRHGARTALPRPVIQACYHGLADDCPKNARAASMGALIEQQ